MMSSLLIKPNSGAKVPLCVLISKSQSFRESFGFVIRSVHSSNGSGNGPPKLPNPKLITVDNMNPYIKVMQYAVRGSIVARAMEIERELREGVKKPFKEVIRANVGDAQAMGQKPITFLRQVLALITCPELLDSPDFKSDVKKKAKSILEGCKGYTVGAYSDSAGVTVIKERVVQYIQKRDGGISADPDNIILCAGASEGIRMCLKMLQDGRKGSRRPAVMLPIPQYPLYTASLAEYNMHHISYFLDEKHNWGLDISELERAISEARLEFNVRAIVIINPGNPTGQVLTRKNIQDIIKFAYLEKLILLADEVYQHNVYEEGSKFYSFKKIMMEMGTPYDQMELVSFNSASKGYTGECGLRGGYYELVNIDPAIKAMILKCSSARLCPTVLGQAAIDCIADPPKEGDPSYDLFLKEKTAILSSLASRAHIVCEGLNKIPGIKCNPIQGALYAFPQIDLPIKAIDAAQELGLWPDALYAFELIDATGICIVPGSGFGQLPGTFHFRTTILPPEDVIKDMIEKIGSFHVKFLRKYS